MKARSASSYFVLSLTIFTFLAIAQAEEKEDVNEFDNIEFFNEPRFILKQDYLKFDSFNKSSVVINFKGNLLEDTPADTVVKVFAFDGNAMTQRPKKVYEGTLCQAMKEDHWFVTTLKASSNFPEECPFPKGEYWIKNLVVNSEKIRNMFPKTYVMYVQAEFTSASREEPLSKFSARLVNYALVPDD